MKFEIDNYDKGLLLTLLFGFIGFILMLFIYVVIVKVETNREIEKRKNAIIIYKNNYYPKFDNLPERDLPTGHRRVINDKWNNNEK